MRVLELRATPRIMSVAFSIGLSTFTGWKRRSRAGSFSMYFLNSAQVGADGASSPARGRLQQVGGASPVPCAPPAPTRVCTSSMKRMIGFAEAFTSSMTPFSRFFELALHAGAGLGARSCRAKGRETSFS